MSLKLIIMGIVYVFTGGALFSGRLNKFTSIAVLAGFVAIASSLFFWQDVYDEFFDLLSDRVAERIEPDESLVEPKTKPAPEKIETIDPENVELAIESELDNATVQAINLWRRFTAGDTTISVSPEIADSDLSDSIDEIFGGTDVIVSNASGVGFLEGYKSILVERIVSDAFSKAKEIDSLSFSSPPDSNLQYCSAIETAAAESTLFVQVTYSRYYHWLINNRDRVKRTMGAYGGNSSKNVPVSPGAVLSLLAPSDVFEFTTRLAKANCLSCYDITYRNYLNQFVDDALWHLAAMKNGLGEPSVSWYAPDVSSVLPEKYPCHGKSGWYFSSDLIVDDEKMSMNNISFTLSEWYYAFWQRRLTENSLEQTEQALLALQSLL